MAAGLELGWGWSQGGSGLRARRVTSMVTEEALAGRVVDAFEGRDGAS
jgi:hypothetical protein